MAAPSYSVLLPAYNEGPVIGDVVARCLALTPPPVEVLVVDDGSTDGTSALAAAAGARVVRLGRNGGKGVALRFALPQTRGDVLVLMDADGQDDPADIPLLLDALQPDVDMVVGSRFLGTFGPNAITPLNRFGNQALTAVVNVLFGTSLTDTQAGVRAMRRETALRWDLAATRYDIEVDQLLSVLRAGGRVVEVPVKRAARGHGRSGLNSFRDGTRILLRILRKRFGAAR
jgi:glycosyltransferase involved in cell wall biosynthesis